MQNSSNEKMFSFYKLIKMVQSLFKGIIDAPASILIDLLFDNIEEQVSWNKLVTESIKIQVSKTTVFYFLLFL